MTTRVETPLFELQPSMSRADILVHCSFPFGQLFPAEETQEPARYGSAFHELIADRILAMKAPDRKPLKTHEVAESWDLDNAACDELGGHVPEAFGVLKAWLLGENPWGYEFLDVVPRVELAFALRPGISSRLIHGHDEHHVYKIQRGEIPGTGDLVIPVPSVGRRVRRPLLVLDHKTGEGDFARPLEKPQLLSLAAAALRSPLGRGQHEAVVGVLHARRRGLAKVYAERVRLRDLADHERRLETGIARIGDGSMRPGPWCRWCPAREHCPAQSETILSRAGDVLSGLVGAGGVLSGGGKVTGLAVVPAGGDVTRERRLGALYEVIQQADTLVATARKMIRQEILETRVVPELSDGRILTVETIERERLSKSSILEAYGKVTGEKLLAKLRKDGAIEKSEEKRLKVMRDY
jgi:hypothetical protein